ncbi:uncharacterized protein V1518DRAFT_425678 [Limtongia smithiae]|uniref:uncharacterized protein n=1 Tax=Limtongia smithiae TaxID=1125753 RepID=UPI0034CDD519
MLKELLILLFTRFSEVIPSNKVYFDETDVGDLTGKVFLVTGGSSGIGLELSRILYYKGGHIIIGGRSKKSYEEAVETIKSASAQGLENSKLRGTFDFVYMDLCDLTTIKPAADELLSKVDRLDIAWYNAGVMAPPIDSKTKQGYELQWGTNVLGHYLLNKYLSDLQLKTAKDAMRGEVRTIWVSSIGHNFGPKPTLINLDDTNFERTPYRDTWVGYGQSKAGDIVLAYEYAKKVSGKGIASLTLHPGGLRTNLARHQTTWFSRLGQKMLKEPRYGALTELYAGFSNEPIDKDLSTKYIVPWGRIGRMNDGLDHALKYEDLGAKLWDLCEKQTAPYA